MKLAGKVGLVTGGSRGIGRACALAMAAAGADVAINYRSHPEEAEQVRREVEQLGRRALAVQADVADWDAVRRMVAETVQTLGRLDLFVSNAAYSDRHLMLESDLAEFRRTVDVTMWGAFHGLRAAAQQMVSQGEGGSIVIVSSPHALIPFPTAMAYNMSKAAIDHMSRTAAIELVEHRIRVNIVHPGWIDTPGERKYFSEEQIASGAKKLPWKRLGTPQEVANAIVFVLSPECDYMTGSTLSIEGGVSLPWWSNRSSGEM